MEQAIFITAATEIESRHFDETIISRRESAQETTDSLYKVADLSGSDCILNSIRNNKDINSFLSCFFQTIDSYTCIWYMILALSDKISLIPWNYIIKIECKIIIHYRHIYIVYYFIKKKWYNILIYNITLFA